MSEPRDAGWEGSARLRLRRGGLARAERPDPSGPVEIREPEELLRLCEDDVGKAAGGPDAASPAPQSDP